MRKLASIQRVLALDPIPGADNIEVASVLGWKCVVKKGEFSPGDLCVYIEVDSVLPDRPEFEFMKPRGMRVRTVKLRGQVSQGLAMPLGVLSQTQVGPMAESEFGEGEDVTALLGIVKYEPPVAACLGGDAKGSFPDFLIKTDEDRIQSFPDILTKYAGTPCRVCEKLDGSSVTYYIKDGEFGVCSRNLDLKETEGNSFWGYARQMNIETRLRDLRKNLAIQGELIGPGIQGNKYKLSQHEVRFFNVFDIDKREYLSPGDGDYAMDILGLPQVPAIGDTLLGGGVPAMVDMATLKSRLNNSVTAEGVVVRSYGNVSETFQTPDGPKTVSRGRLSFKVISPAFLLKNDE